MRTPLSLALLLCGCGLITDLDPRPDGSGLDAAPVGRDAGPPREDAGPRDGAATEAGALDGGACSEEVCNGLDDDCDGRVDECDLPHARASCAAGACEIQACAAGFDDCNGDAADGCETDLTRDGANCGECGLTCVDTLCYEGACSDPYADVSAGALHTCARTEAGDLYCWGRNTAGEIGLGTLGGDVLRPTHVDAMGDVSFVDAAKSFTCAITSTGVRCWGRGDEGQLGDGTMDGLAAPAAAIRLGAEVRALAAGYQGVVVAIEPSGELRGWGDNSDAQLGTGSSTPSAYPSPTATSALRGATQVAMGNHFACAVVDGAVQCWGDNARAQLGRGPASSTLPYSAIPAPVVGIDAAVRILEVAAGRAHACARGAGGEVFCWGDNMGLQSSGRAGSMSRVLGATQIDLPGPASDISAGGNTSCAVVDGEVYCWGSNSAGQAGIGSFGPRVPSGTPVSGLAGVRSVDCGHAHTCALSWTEIYCWGDNGSGQLGIGTRGGVFRTPQLVEPRVGFSRP